MLASLGVVSFLAVLGVLAVFPPVFDGVPAELAGSVQLALVLAGINLGLSLVFGTFDAMLWAYQRFDLVNVIDIPTDCLRVALVVLVIGQGGGLVALAGIALLVTAVSGLAKVIGSVVATEITPRLLHLSLVKWPVAKEILGYSFWTFVGVVTP